MEKKYLALLIIVMLGSVVTTTALLFYEQTLSLTVIDQNGAILVTDLLDVPIADLGILELFEGEVESIFWRVQNNYDSAVDIMVTVNIGGTGVSMTDGEIGISIDGAGYIGQPLDTPFALPLGSYVDIGLALGHDGNFNSPTVEVIITAEA